MTGNEEGYGKILDAMDEMVEKGSIPRAKRKYPTRVRQGSPIPKNWKRYGG